MVREAKFIVILTCLSKFSPAVPVGMLNTAVPLKPRSTSCVGPHSRTRTHWHDRPVPVRGRGNEQRPSRRPAPTEGRTGPRARGPGSEYAGPQSHEPSHRQAVLVNGPGELGELEVSQVTVPVVLASVGVGAPRQR